MTVSGIAIRPAAADESDSVADLVFGDPDQETRRIASALYGVEDSEALRPMFRAVWRAGENWRQTFVAVTDPEIVGIVQCGRSSMRVTPTIALHAVRALGLRALSAPKAMRLADRVAPTKPADALVVSELHVHPAHRGTGIGATLLAFAEDLAAQRGHPRVALHTYTTNPARRLYERCGYVAEETKTDPEFLRRTGVAGNVLYVKKLLGPG